MKVVILAGGAGTRLSEETGTKPKPLVEIGGYPILWHILKIYSHYGFHEFIICLGYKGYLIKEYFSNYFLHMSDVTFDMERNAMEVHQKHSEPWKVTLVNTGEATNTGGRIKRIADYVGHETFMLTYGDGVADININELLQFHRRNHRWATLTTVQPPGRFGLANINSGNEVLSFVEKPVGDGSWINGGFFVLEPRVFDFIKGDETIWEQEPLENLAAQKQLMAYKHTGFWRPMDSLRDKNLLEDMWSSQHAPWKIWD
ncbi:MAG: glucose-1-phosphate cytidylyltransferase [Syntrophomonadaceae bacterium]|nr:glucose-1-phosphate cytidylyltransferase [Syntrophomonadaceae bacterium]